MPIYYIIIGVVGLVVGFFVGFLLYIMEVHRRRADREKADLALKEVKSDAEKLKKEVELSVKEQFYKRREDLDRELDKSREEIRNIERRIEKREDSLDRKAEMLGKKETFLRRAERDTQKRRERLTRRQHELEEMREKEQQLLYEIGSLTQEEAQNRLFERLEKELERETALFIAKRVETAQQEAEKEAKNILTTAIQRVAAEHTQDVVVTTVELPNEEMKGRVIGREGRNIRTFQRLTGIDVVIDDTPGIVVLSGFDSVRREMARRAMEKLVADGRIHPARIEEVLNATKQEMNKLIMKTGREAAMDADVHNLHPREIMLIGRLKFRTSYGQNVLNHSLEVAHLCGVIAAELDLDIKLAKRCGLLHDIGKAVDHEIEGGHPEIGAALARRYKEQPKVVNAIAAHHEGVPFESLYAVITAAADAVSASRPGARRETLEKYLQRLERLEEVATSFDGIRNAYAIQAGREVRIIVDPRRIDDATAVTLARDIANKIEKELRYAGQIKVIVMRETKVTEYAK